MIKTRDFFCKGFHVNKDKATKNLSAMSVKKSNKFNFSRNRRQSQRGTQNVQNNPSTSLTGKTYILFKKR